MKRLAVCVLVASLLLLGLLPGQAQAQSFEVEDVSLQRSNYPTVRSSEGPVRVYAGEWQLLASIRNYDKGQYIVTVRMFLDNILIYDKRNSTYYSSWSGSGVWDPFSAGWTIVSFSTLGEHEFLIQVWYEDETQPRTTYSFDVLVLKPEVSNLQASSKVVRGLGENSLAVSFANGGNTSMRQAVLSVADSGGLTLEPDQVELGDIDPGETSSASFEVSAPASVHIGTARTSFSLSFIDYAGVQHEETEDVYAEVEVYRLSPTLTLSLPSSVENGNTVSISATLKDPEGNPVPNENIGLSVGGVDLGVFKTGTDGVARASYTATETGALDVEASFPGSASYDVASDSGTLTVTPATPFGASFPSWVLPVILIALVFAVSATYLKRKKRGQGRKTLGSGMLSCLKCGAEIPGNSAFCPFCGAKLRGRRGS